MQSKDKQSMAQKNLNKPTINQVIDMPAKTNTFMQTKPSNSSLCFIYLHVTFLFLNTALPANLRHFPKGNKAQTDSMTFVMLSGERTSAESV